MRRIFTANRARLRRRGRLNTGLAFACSGNPQRAMNAVTSIPPGLARCNVVDGPYGLAAQFHDGSTQYGEWSSNSTLESCLGGITLIVGWNQHVAFNVSQMAIVQKCRGAGLGYHSYQLKRNYLPSTVLAFEVRGTFGTANAVSTHAVQIGRPYAIVGRWETGGQVTLDMHDLLSGARLGSDASAGTFSGSIEYPGVIADRQLRLAANEGSPNPGTVGKGTLHYCYIWNRRLDDQDVRDVLADPVGSLWLDALEAA